jgi:heme-degrading monooxygenase HmoA
MSPKALDVPARCDFIQLVTFAASSALLDSEFLCGWIPLASRNTESNGVTMFARKVVAVLEPDSLSEFISIIEKEILPWLRKQDGFLDLIVLAMRESEEVAAISFWDHQADAEAWATRGFPETAQILSKLIHAGPHVKTFDVVSSTVHPGSQIVQTWATLAGTTS